MRITSDSVKDDSGMLLHVELMSSFFQGYYNNAPACQVTELRCPYLVLAVILLHWHLDCN